MQDFKKLAHKAILGTAVSGKGNCTGTIGLDEEKIRKYVRWQREKDRRMDQLKMWK